MIIEINVFSVSDEMLRVMGQTGCRQVDWIIGIMFTFITCIWF